MEWKDWSGKKVFVQLKSGGVYSGIIQEVTDVGDNIVFFDLLDKFGEHVVFVASEIIKLKEEPLEMKKEVGNGRAESL